MKEAEDNHGKYREYLVVWSEAEGKYVEVDTDSPEGKEIMKQLLLINLSRKRRRK